MDRLAKHSEKEKRGVYVSTKDQKRSEKNRDDSYYGRDYGRRDRDRRGRDYDRDRDRQRDRDYGRRSDRSGHDRDRDRHSDRGSNRSDLRRHHDSERSLHTPRFKDEPRTPSINMASASWDDDDDTGPSKKSSWDFPTPKGDSKRSEWSMRSSSSSIYKMKKQKAEDDTPRPTPAHKYNAWANDRKRSGATPLVGKLKLKKKI